MEKAVTEFGNAPSTKLLNVAVSGSAGSGVTSITSFLAKNYLVKSAEQSTQGVVPAVAAAACDELNLVFTGEERIRLGVSKAESLIDKEAVLVVIDASAKSLDKSTYTRIFSQIANLKLNPLIFFNKLDAVIFGDAVKSTENVYSILVDKIDELNAIIEDVNAALINPESSSLAEIDPSKPNVFFGSAIDGWAFNLERFAHEYAKKLKIDHTKMLSKLWGENFYDEPSKKWLTSRSESKNAQQPRSFCSLVLEPIWNIYHLVRQGYIDGVLKLIQALNIKVDASDKKGRMLLRMTMFAWMNSAEALVKGLLTNVPSFAEGIHSHGRYSVFSHSLKEQQCPSTSEALILAVFAKSKTNNIAYAKVLRKCGGPIDNSSRFLGFTRDVFQSANQILFENVDLSESFRVHLRESEVVDWSKIVEGEVIDIVGDLVSGGVIQNGMIVTTSKDVASNSVFKNYSAEINSISLSVGEKSAAVNVVNDKAPMAVGNSILGSVKRVNSALSAVLCKRNSLFFSRQELLEHLKEKGEFAQKDIDAIIAIEGDSVVFNYAKEETARNHDERLANAFKKAIQVLKIGSARIEIESITTEQFNENLESEIQQELKSIVLS